VIVTTTINGKYSKSAALLSILPDGISFEIEVFTFK